MSEELIRVFGAAIPLPVVVVAQSERIIAANADARALLGQNIIGRHFATILRQPAVLDAIEAGLKDKAPRTARHISNDGAQDTAFEVTCRYVETAEAMDSGALVLSFQDVSHLEQVGQMRRDFVANVSHELRTPLTALMGFIETLRGPARDDATAREKFLAIMADEAGRMNRLIADLLSLSRVEGQERVRPRDQVNLSEQLASTITSLNPLAEKGAVSLSLSQPDDAVFVTGDGDQLRQVFTNLIENAIKYGGSGGVVDVVLTRSDRDPGLRTAAASVQVIDKGPGIDSAHLPRLTERFYRGDEHRNRAQGGTGLGLAIVKHIVNRHRGRMRIDSDVGQGSVFTVILPE